MMVRPYDPEAETAHIRDPVSRRQAQITYELFNNLWCGSGWRRKLQRNRDRR